MVLIRDASSMDDIGMIREAVDILDALGVDTSGLCLRRGEDVPLEHDRSRILSSCDYSYSSRLLMENPSTFSDSEEEARFYIIWNVVGVVVSVAFVAVIAGLFLGLLTLDALDLQIIQRVSIDERERQYAANLFPIVKDKHRLLVTLLILNSLGYESLPIFLGRLVPGWAAVILSTSLVLLFGEIVPSAVFTGPKQLMLGSSMVPLVKIFLFVLSPLAVPLAMFLDRIVYGADYDPKLQQQQTKNTSYYDRAELSALVRIQYEDRIARKRLSGVVPNKKENERRSKDASWSEIKRELVERAIDRESIARSYSEDGTDPSNVLVPVETLTPPLHQTEVDLVTGALQMKTRAVMDVYTPLRNVYVVADNLVLDKDAISEIYSQGYSRIPVYRSYPDFPDNRSAILGFLMTRQLMLIDWDDKRLVSTLPLQRPMTVSPRMNLVDLMNHLRVGGHLMAFVCARPDLAKKALSAERPIPVEAGFMGIITLEDVMESILQDPIHDESDIRDRERAVATLNRWAVTKLQNFVRKNKSRLRRDSNSEGKSTETTLLLSDATANRCISYSHEKPQTSSKKVLKRTLFY